MAILLIVIPHGAQAQAKSKSNNCYEIGYKDGLDHPFSAGAFDRCGARYQDGFLAGCKAAGNDFDACESAEDNQVD